MTTRVTTPRHRRAPEDGYIINRPAGSGPAPYGSTDRGRLSRFLRGAPQDPRWARPGLFALLIATAILYLWDLSASGYANSFYAAAVQAGSQSWKAWFFGSLDSGNSITVDKPPASLWVMGLSARLFGFNSWSLLVPQALEGVAAVGLLYGAVRRISGHGAGLAAGAVLAITPAAVLMFRFDNPDALLTLLLVVAGYGVTRALEAASAKWLMLAGAALGFAFLTKMLQGFLVIPAFALVYLIAAPTSLRQRIKHTLLAGLAVLVSGGWYVAVVSLWPASSRPYIGGSTDNSILNLVFGYNGFGRVLGGEGNGGNNGTAGSGFGGATGLTRLFGSEMGNEISWLLPAALVAIVLGLVLTRRAPRTDRTRAAILAWGGWLIITGLVFSYMKGTVHPYYTVALAPAIAALVAISTRELWRHRSEVLGRVGLCAMTIAAGGWSYELLARTPSWHPELRYIVAAATVLTAAGLLIPRQRLGKAAAALIVTGILAGVLGSGAFAAATAASPHTGSIPSVGPAQAQTSGMGGGGQAPSGMGGGGQAPSGSLSGTRPGGAPGSSGGPGGAPSSGSSSTGSTQPGSATSGAPASGSAMTGSRAGTGAPAGGGGGMATSSALTGALKATATTWAAATAGDQSAAQLELDSGKAVIAIGGWSGTDASPTLAQFKAYVAAGKITYFIAGNSGGPGGGSNGVASQITAWVKANFTSKTIGSTTVYVLTSKS
jgi:4-amino-4-deoxy-L-arabinose transferase-like glycosyltransferase